MIPVLQDIDYNENQGYRVVTGSNEFLRERLTEYYEENRRDLYHAKERLSYIRAKIFRRYVMMDDCCFVRKYVMEDLKEAKHDVKALKKERKQLVKQIKNC